MKTDVFKDNTASSGHLDSAIKGSDRQRDVACRNDENYKTVKATFQQP